MQRKAVVAGQFYEARANMLDKQVQSMVQNIADKRRVLGIISPHAGFIYSGPVAGAVFSHCLPTETYLILGVNHRAVGARAGLFSGDGWEMPFGEMAVDRELNELLLQEIDILQEDNLSHQYEHSIEVQLPFIHHFAPKAKIVTISLGIRTVEECTAIGKGIARALDAYSRTVTLVASTDMSHYVPHEVAVARDKPAIDAILALDAVTLVNYVKRNPGMCGVMPTASVIVAAKQMRADRAELVRYATSGDTSGDYSSVVGYAGLLIPYPE